MTSSSVRLAGAPLNPKETRAVSDIITERIAEIRANDYRRDRRDASAYRQSDLAAVDVPALIAAVEAAVRHHEPVETANGWSICPLCSRAAGTSVLAPCDEVKAVAAALSQDAEETR